MSGYTRGNGAAVGHAHSPTDPSEQTWLLLIATKRDGEKKRLGRDLPR